MDNLSKCFIFLLAIVAGLLFFNLDKTSKEVKTPLLSPKSLVNLNDLGNINYSFNQVPKDVTEFFKTNSDYSKIYNNKKIVVYYTGAGCPYGRIFEKSIKRFKTKNNSDYYTFHSESATGFHKYSSKQEAETSIKFANLCHEFCVINPKKEEIFAIDGVGEEEAQKLDLILEALLTW